MLNAEFGEHAFDESEISQALDESIAGPTSPVAQEVVGASATEKPRAGVVNRALLPPLSLGFVSAIGVVMIAPISSYIAPLGARLAHALQKRQLEIGFGLFLIVASLRFLVDLIAA